MTDARPAGEPLDLEVLKLEMETAMSQPPDARLAWQPIETAPRDVLVLLCGAGWNRTRACRLSLS